MKIYDITQELFSCRVYPGDTAPTLTAVSRIREGAECNLSDMTLCTHNGTHIDAPCHFLPEGDDIARLSPERFVGPCLLAEYSGIVTAEDLLPILSHHPERLLLKGGLELTPDAAEAIADAGVRLLGVESQSVAPPHDPRTIHVILLRRDVILLEGLALDAVPPGGYFLSAAPLKLAGSDGAPCRALLWEMENPGGRTE